MTAVSLKAPTDRCHSLKCSKVSCRRRVVFTHTFRETYMLTYIHASILSKTHTHTQETHMYISTDTHNQTEANILMHTHKQHTLTHIPTYTRRHTP